MKSFALCFLIAFFAHGTAMAGDAVAGKQKAAACIGCHGDHGTPAKPNVPKIDRMTSDTLKAAMEKMREVHHDSPITPDTLSEQDIEDIAAYLTYSQ